MGEQRQRYTDEFKQQTVKHIQEQTKSVADIALELNIPAGTLHQWLAKYRQFENEPLVSVDRIRELEQKLEKKDRELEDVKDELTIVKKAVHIFSNQGSKIPIHRTKQLRALGGEDV